MNYLKANTIQLLFMVVAADAYLRSLGQEVVGK